MRAMRRRLAVLLLAALGAAAFQAAAAEHQRSFLWRAERDGRTIHLLGSIHFMKAAAAPLAPAIEDAYRRSGLVLFETDIEGLDRAAVALLAAGTLGDGETLAGVLPADLHREVAERAASLGMGAGAFDRMRPWMVALTVTSLELMRAGYLGSAGIDAALSARAAADGKLRRGLETIDEQVALFAGLSEAEGVDFLRYSLAELDTAIPLVDELVEAWRTGDVEKLEELMVEGFEGHPELYDRMVTARNRRWLPVVEELLAGDTEALVVVGALHLVGEHGLVELLRAAGCTVVQL
jgi:uncharacterized protein YbaP (TraB family)